MKIKGCYKVKKIKTGETSEVHITELNDLTVLEKMGYEIITKIKSKI